MTAQAVVQSLEAFLQRARAMHGVADFEAPFDPEWRSACERGEPTPEGRVPWWPVSQNPGVDFSGLAHALDVPVHEDVCAYYSTWWSGSLEARSAEGHVSLIQLWNPQDFDRLVENLVGHALMKRRARQPFTVFFANTDTDSELFLSIDNESGKVLLEEPGRAPLKVVEASVAAFLDRLEPLNAAPGIY